MRTRRKTVSSPATTRTGGKRVKTQERGGMREVFSSRPEVKNESAATVVNWDARRGQCAPAPG